MDAIKIADNPCLNDGTPIVTILDILKIIALITQRQAILPEAEGFPFPHIIVNLNASTHLRYHPEINTLTLPLEHPNLLQTLVLELKPIVADKKFYNLLIDYIENPDKNKNALHNYTKKEKTIDEHILYNMKKRYIKDLIQAQTESNELSEKLIKTSEQIQSFTHLINTMPQTSPITDFLKACPEIIDYTASENTLTLSILSELTIYDREYAKQVNAIKTNPILKAVFIDQKYNILTQTKVQINIANGNFNILETPGWERAIPQPHIHQLKCWGQAKDECKRLWASGKYIESITQLLYATRQITLSDNYAVDAIKYFINIPSFRHVKYYKDNKTGELMNRIEVEEKCTQN